MRVSTILIMSACLAATASARGQQAVPLTPIDPNREITDLGSGLHVITLTFPGNVAVLAGPDGVMLIDDQLAPLADQIADEIAQITGGGDAKVRFVVNSHYHFDHSSGNEVWQDRGATVVAHAHVRKRLSSAEQRNFTNETTNPQAPEGMWPVITFSEDLTFHLNGQTVHVWHPGPAHTDGDAVIFFEEANVVHTGDIYLNTAFPVMDFYAGGSLDGTIAAREAILSRIDDKTRIIPGHGPVGSKSDLAENTAKIREMRDTMAAMIAEGMNEAEILAAKPFASYDAEFGRMFPANNSDTFVIMAYRTMVDQTAAD